MILSNYDKSLMDGSHGEAAALAMSVIVRMAEIVDAPALMDVTQAHIDGCGLMSESSLEFIEMIARKGGRAVIPTTLNIISLDLVNWRELGVDENWAERVQRQASAYQQVGCIPTWTCAPYYGYLTPRFGQQIAWAESNAIVYANSVLGSRTNRYADFFDICAAITGRVPEYGLHITSQRAGQILFQVQDLPAGWLEQDWLFPVLGYLIGKGTRGSIPVIQGLLPHTSNDQLKALGAASASSGAVGLFHAVGVTPEAATVSDAFHGKRPQGDVQITKADVENARHAMSTADEGAPLDAVILGCPHYSFMEFRRLAEIMATSGMVRSENCMFVVCTSAQTMALVERDPFIMGALTRFGVTILKDSCVFHCPLLPKEFRVVMTDSGKHAYYAPGELSVRAAFGSTEDCVLSALEGRVRRRVRPCQ